MDGSTLDHSDSDSGDSWTILEHSPAYGDDAPGFAENSLTRGDLVGSNIDKDEDTDGISIISDSEPDSSTPCELIQDRYINEGNRLEQSSPHFISVSPLIPNSNDIKETIRTEDDFLEINTAKHKTYVHRRNKRLSTVLNIIMLGSVITAAGVAIGHMWGAKNDCSMHTTPSINKILSNLYKLQEENTYLRNKLKELTLVNTIQMQQKKLTSTDRSLYNQPRCKKIYEQPLDSKNSDKITKCIDTEIKNNADKNNNHFIQPEFEKEFVRDIDKLKYIYQQNRSWLDAEVVKRLNHENETLKKKVKSPLSSIIEEQKVLQDENMKPFSNVDNNQPQLNISPDAEQLIQLELDADNNEQDKQVLSVKKITYADSLKSDQPQKLQLLKDTNVKKDHKDKVIKRRIKKDKDDIINDVMSEEDFKKDDRYTAGHKHKQEKKKRDRQKLHKKQKRRNKYEQWEMKGGYMKDYDDLSIISFQENDNTILKKSEGNRMNREFEKTHYINQLLETESIQNINVHDKLKETKNIKKFAKARGKNVKEEAGGKNVKGEAGGKSVKEETGGKNVKGEAGGKNVKGEAGGKSVKREAGGKNVKVEASGKSVKGEADGKNVKGEGGGKNVKGEDLSWFDKRAAIRTEARKKLEHELFGETSPNNAGWYFRRMQKREQCRAKGENSTLKKLFKSNMNFKTKL